MARSSFGTTQVVAYCGSRPGAVASRPFGPEPLVFKAAGKIFALVGGRSGRAAVSLKCDPDRSLLLRTSFAAITPGYHLNKEHWNTLALDGSLPARLVKELIDHSHELVTRARAKADRAPAARPARKPSPRRPRSGRTPARRSRSRR
jgi:predicted DNA-binding protein (MmcQ/YjbR family)